MPLSNCEVGGGIAPVPDLLAAGVTVGLGSDGYITDMFEVMRGAFLIHKAHRQDPRVMPANVVWKLATEGGAQALGLDRGRAAGARLAGRPAADRLRPAHAGRGVEPVRPALALSQPPRRAGRSWWRGSGGCATGSCWASTRLRCARGRTPRLNGSGRSSGRVDGTSVHCRTRGPVAGRRPSRRSLCWWRQTATAPPEWILARPRRPTSSVGLVIALLLAWLSAVVSRWLTCTAPGGEGIVTLPLALAPALAAGAVLALVCRRLDSTLARHASTTSGLRCATGSHKVVWRLHG